MNRLVFELAETRGPDGTQHVEISLEEPSLFGTQPQPFSVRFDDPAFVALRNPPLANGAVSQAGQVLYAALLAHPEVGQYLATALQTKPPNRYPLYVQIRTAAGIETIPWELLCTPGGDFLGLDERWSFGRIVPGTAALGSPFWHFEPPLRVAAVLSCLGVPADAEWQALRDATRAGAVPVELLIVVSEEDLYTAIDTDVKAGRLPGVRVELVPQDLALLQSTVAAFRPHVLHFFCHGTGAGSPRLDVAVKSDWLDGIPDNSLLIEARDIGGFKARTDDVPWLVVLNCCDSAATGDDLQSLALRVVSGGHAPAVVAMREPVLSDDANVLTSTLYPALLSDLAARLAGNAADEPVDWARLIVGARAALARAHARLPLTQAAAVTKEWTLPVVYVRPAPFAMRVVAGAQPVPAAPPGPPAAPAEVPSSPRVARLEVEALQGLLAQLPPRTPDALRASIAERVATLAEHLT